MKVMNRPLNSQLMDSEPALRKVKHLTKTYIDPESGLHYCERCHTPAEYISPIDGRPVPCMCKCLKERRDKLIAEERAKAKNTREQRRIDNCFVAPAMRNMTFDRDDGESGTAMETARSYARQFGKDTDFGLLFFGKPDAGKTFASACIANELLDRGLRVVVRSMPRLIMDLGKTSDTNAMLDELMSSDLLVIDDLGAERDTSYGQELVYSLIDGRYCTRAPMIVSTNLTRDELMDRTDVSCARIYGRVLEMCLPVEFDSNRRRATKDNYACMRAKLGL